MNIILYLQCFAVGVIGMTIHAIIKMKHIQDKARRNNIEFKPYEYFVKDWASHVATLLTIIMFMFFIEEFANFNQIVLDYAKIGFAFVGYTGSDIASRLFSVVDKRINSAIDYKTTIADEANGTLDKPTPAA